jgi:hypothetical protein
MSGCYAEKCGKFEALGVTSPCERRGLVREHRNVERAARASSASAKVTHLVLEQDRVVWRGNVMRESVSDQNHRIRSLTPNFIIDARPTAFAVVY